MEPNKVINLLFKQLLRKEYKHETIKNFLSLKDKFSNFEHFLLYVLILGERKYEDDTVKMCCALHDYIIQLILKYKIIKPTIDELHKYDIKTNEEIFLLGARGYDGFQKFYFDVDENIYICLDNVDHIEYKDLYHISLNYIEPNVFASKINEKIICKKFNKILLFKKQGHSNLFLGFYTMSKTLPYFKNDWQYYGVILTDKNNDMVVQEYENLNRNMAQRALIFLKQNLFQLIVHNQKDYFYKLLDLNSEGTNIYLLIHQVLQHCLAIDNKDMLNALVKHHSQLLSQELSVSCLIPKLSIISSWELVLFANSFDILYGMQITTNYLHNVFICLESKDVLDKQEISLRFVKSYKQLFFDLDINKKIFNTSKEPTAIYLFTKIDNDHFKFQGYYKVSRIIVGEDLQENPTPIFILRKFEYHEFTKHLIYIEKNIVSNNYKNHFVEFISHPKYGKWIKSNETISVSATLRLEEKHNSLLFKYNWIIKKCLASINSEDYDKYWLAYKKFDDTNLLHLIKCINYDFQYLAENKIVQPWTLAYEMTKHNWAFKELFSIAYIDYYLSKQYKYDVCTQLISLKKI